MQNLLLGATYINFVFKLYYQYAQLEEINETMQPIALLCSILILTKLFGSALQIILGRKQTKNICCDQVNSNSLHVVSKEHQLDRYNNSGILTSLNKFLRELKNENHKNLFLKRNHNGN